MDVAEFRIDVFVQRLFPQYERLWAASRIVRNSEFEQWVAKRLVSEVQSKRAL